MIDASAWPVERLHEALGALASASGLAAAGAASGPTVSHAHADLPLDAQVDAAARGTGVDAEPVAARVADCADLLRRAGPALLTVRSAGSVRLLLLLPGRGRRVRLLGPDHRVRGCPVDVLRDALCAPLEHAVRGDVERVLAAADLPPRRRAVTRRALIADRLAGVELTGCWILRAPRDEGLWRQVARTRGPRRIGAMLATFAVLYGLELAGWWVIGGAVLGGRLDAGWLVAWGLLLLSLVPLRMFGAWLDAHWMLDLGVVLKRRLLAGALGMDLDAARAQGAGQLLARAMEAQVFEASALGGTLALLVGLLELLFAATLLAAGAGGWPHAGLALVWLGATVACAFGYHRRSRAWVAGRLAMTRALVERMIGHRTCLVQEPPQARRAADDASLSRYHALSRALDRSVVPLYAVLPAAWMMAGLAGLAPALLAADADPVRLAIGVGGVLFAARAFAGLDEGLANLSRARIAWRSLRGLLSPAVPERAPATLVARTPAVHSGGAHAAAEHPAADHTAAAGHAPDGAVLLQADALSFSHAGAAAPVLDGVALTVHHGDRILLEGGSGGGKSTLAATLTGLRAPSAGLLLLGGLDRATLGDDWHRLATQAPQFHDNHILSGPLAFNLLMGRGWPASAADLDEARAVCEELGLGDLIARMPAGLMQMVGETGWQLSHGERSRIFLARALLQRAPLTILDESFAALDPDTLARCLRCAQARSDALIVVAHP